MKCPAAASQQQPSSLCCSWEELGEMMGLGQRRSGWHHPKYFFPPTHSCCYWHIYSCKHQSLVTQATQSRPGSSATPTSNKKVGPCVRHLSNKPSPLFLDSSHSPLTALLPAWLVGYHQLGQSSCRESGMLTRPGGHTLLSSLLAAAGQSTQLKAPC